jgi:aspartyl-tRNA(Asn)/glutamyl-tRNA(Gln) amidotransferase subunit A
MDAHRLTLSEAVRLIRDGVLTPTRYAESLLDRIDALEPIVDAWVTVEREKVLAAAEEASKEAAEGVFRSPLHGVPVGVKDIYYTEGILTTMGSPLFRGFVPSNDADVVKSLKRAGAIILGKTETTEFALHDPAPTRNPWNTGHTPGGSSSGSAAAVSCGMAPLALGTQTGGSVVRPASYCGVVGFKGTYDLLSRGGVYPLSWSLDHVGFMTRTVEDALLVLKTLRPDLSEGPQTEKPPRLGLLSGYFKENASGEVWQGFERAVGKLWGEGAEIVDVRLPEVFSLAPSVHRVIMSVEAAAVHEDEFRERADEYGDYLRGFISSGLLVPATSYLRAQRIRGLIIQEVVRLLKCYDALICPSTVDTAPEGLNWTGSPAFNIPWSLTGLPSVTVPSGLSGGGLPMGLQMVGRPYGDVELLRTAAWCEEALEFPHEPKDPYIPQGGSMFNM